MNIDFFGLVKPKYNDEGFDKKGFDVTGYDKDGFDRKGYNIEGFNRVQVVRFRKSLNEYSKKLKDSEANLAICYLECIGVKKDTEKAFELMIEGAFNKSYSSLRLLGDYYYCGENVPKNLNLAQFLYALAEGKNLPTVYQYKAMTPTTFMAKDKIQETAFKAEEKHLETVLNCINSNIQSMESEINTIDSNTWWMDRDQRQWWVIQNNSNRLKREAISKFENLKFRPYYARMDSMSSGRVETYYIGEEDYMDSNHPEANIISVWSEFGRKYRAKNEHKFSINGHKYEITLRRRFDITNGKLTEIFDDYFAGTTAAEAQITDPYLLRVLEEKKGKFNITNIIRSIQLNQNNIIDYDFDKSLIVQGCAGSGKTMILLHRIANMKYNIRNLDFTKIKLITPNRQFNLFIDELSKNLGIEQIEKLTLGEYYISLLGRYRTENQEQYVKKANITIKEGMNKGDEIEQLVNVWRETGPTEKDELKTLSDDFKLSFDIVCAIYSNEFANALVKEAKLLSGEHTKKKDYGLITTCFLSAFEKALAQVGINKKITQNYTCVLYARVLFMFVYYGRLNRADSLLCIDEGQDISRLQYALLQKVNGDNVKLNIYGDLDQQIPECCGIENWNKISGIIEAKNFILNENYRNSQDIIDFYNKSLSLNNKSFGLKTKSVEKISIDKLSTQIKLQLLLKNRTAIIINNFEKLPQNIRELCTADVLTQNKVTLLTVRQAKGLEFDTVFVFDAYMNKNERYVSYSRALSELYTIE